jgi:hypothetical protein
MVIGWNHARRFGGDLPLAVSATGEFRGDGIVTGDDLLLVFGIPGTFVPAVARLGTWMMRCSSRNPSPGGKHVVLRNRPPQAVD